MSLGELEDAFVNVSFDDEPLASSHPFPPGVPGHKGPKDEFTVWSQHSTWPLVLPSLTLTCNHQLPPSAATMKSCCEFQCA